MDSVLSFSYEPIKAVSILGFIFFLCSVFIGISVLVEKFTVGTPIIGWASLMCVVLCAAGLNFVFLGIIGEYVWRALDASRNRPPFIIDEIRKGFSAADKEI